MEINNSALNPSSGAQCYSPKTHPDFSYPNDGQLVSYNVDMEIKAIDVELTCISIEDDVLGSTEAGGISPEKI
jgi:hypothetical protein